MHIYIWIVLGKKGGGEIDPHSLHKKEKNIYLDNSAVSLWKTSHIFLVPALVLSLYLTVKCWVYNRGVAGSSFCMI